MHKAPKSLVPYSLSDHYDGKTFRNQHHLQDDKGLLAILKWQFQHNRVAWPKWVDDNLTPNITHPCTETDCAVTFINHATVLLQFDSVTIITDPLFSHRCSPFSFLGPKRHRKPGVSLSDLPKIDIILISHNHYDHMDIPSLRYIQAKYQATIIVPLGNQKILARHGLTHITELDWWQSVAPKPQLKVTMTPMQHWSARGIWDRNHALWGGFVIQKAGKNLLFAGDTGFNDHFSQIAKRFGKMQLSLLPIGAYEPRWFMKDHHMNPEEAVKAHIDLQSELSLAIHFGTFQLTDEGIDDPAQALKISLSQHSIPADTFLIPKNGETFIIKL